MNIEVELRYALRTSAVQKGILYLANAGYPCLTIARHQDLIAIEAAGSAGRVHGHSNSGSYIEALRDAAMKHETKTRKEAQQHVADINDGNLLDHAGPGPAGLHDADPEQVQS